MKKQKSIQKERPRAAETETVLLHELPVLVTRKRMKTMRLRVRSSDRTVHLSIPTGVSRERAMLFLSSKEAWLREVLASLSPPPTEPKYESGDEILLWGIRYTLSVEEGSPALVLSEGDRTAHLFVRSGSTRESRRRVLDAYRRDTLESLLTEVLPAWEMRTGLVSASHDIRTMKSRWGSCNVKTRHVRLNLRLTEHPKACTEYVVLHELCHLRFPNHGKDFHALVEHFMPEWKAVRALLNGKE